MAVNDRVILKVMQNDIAYIKKKFDKIDRRLEEVDDLKVKIAVAADRQRFWNVTLVVLNTALVSIAASMGLRR